MTLNGEHLLLHKMRFLSEFRKISRQLKRKPYPMQKIWEMLLNLECFQYAFSLELNKSYYRIHLSKEVSKLCTIILP